MREMSPRYRLSAEQMAGLAKEGLGWNERQRGGVEQGGEMQPIRPMS